MVDGSQPTATGCSKIDLLFVIDDSGSMAEEQANLTANFPQFVDVLDNYELSGGGTLDYRIGVTTTGRTFTYNMEILPGFPVPTTQTGANGALQQKCGMTKKWLERTDPDVAGTFACVADVGTGGPGIEMQMYATKLALGDRVQDGTNAGFLRDDALLAVVILTDEEDCSREDDNITLPFDAPDPCVPSQLKTPLDYIGFLDQLKGDRGRWATAVIAGPEDCTSDFGSAVGAERLKEFVAETGPNGVFSSICSGNLAMALADAVNTFDAACQDFPDID